MNAINFLVVLFHPYMAPKYALREAVWMKKLTRRGAQ